MRAVVRVLPQSLVFALLGVAVALAVVLPQRVSATHNPVISYMQRGLIGSVDCSNWRDDPVWGGYWVQDSHYCWHDDEPGTMRAIDYIVDNGPTPGASVYFHYRGDFQHFMFVNIPYFTTCHGVAAALYWQHVGDDDFREGTVNYLHIDFAGTVGTIPDEFEWLGTVRNDEPDTCAWTDPHLHQSADSTGDNRFYYNRWENPWRDYYHPHTIYWPALQSDADGDSYGDNLELRLSTDPQDSCPDSSTAWNERGFDYYEPISPWPPDFDDNRVINILDVGKVLPPYFGSTSGSPNYYARRDLHDGNGVINILDVGDVLPPYFGTSCP